MLLRRVRPTLFLGACGLTRALSSLAPVDFGAPGLVGGPEGAPAVIVIQEWWGITDGIKDKAQKLADEGGYRVLVPDIYKGKVGVDAEEASHLMSTLDFQNAVREIAQAAAFLKAEGSPAVGVVGFCMGGALTMGALAASKDITCGAPFYGVNYGLFDIPTQLVDKAVQGHFGELDSLEGFADAATGRKLQEDLRAAGNRDAELFIYEGVGHAFMNDSPAPYASFEERLEKQGAGFPPYDAAKAQLAWGRLLRFFDSNLKPAKEEL